MADSAPEVAEAERFEAPEAVSLKAKTIADQIKRSKHFIVFTGAGISTSAGIPDFRGPDGVWTLRKQKREAPYKATSALQAIPTPTHMALVELQNRGLLKYLVSQNCDGLHRKSGIAPEVISELHGNSNREYCRDCGKEYIRDFWAVAPYTKTVTDHRTGRKCSMAGCNGVLLDTIINFGEFLSEQPLKLAKQNGRQADFCLVLGSSLTVPPACTIPEIAGKKKKGKLAICNLQSTPLDHLVDEESMRVFAKTDDLMIAVMEHLGLETPQFVLRRRLTVKVEMGERDRHQIILQGVDVDGTPSTFLKSVKLEGSRRPAVTEPVILVFRMEDPEEIDLKLELEFMGNYLEPNVDIVHSTKQLERLYLLEYSPYTREWQVTAE
ncbi:putative mono-ADP-ribosyltransferase sirtuin [Triangularia setosa]|uniref:protein acetyllysine N-acetyltransferase n=1 Tax=Triangularia setosa TaxID=2587417 RepID=A0AAN7A5A9_9PEZI|nr:putative mono-ADP-ribosyltransferase sirtuin [Podospora setosa]